MCNFFFSVPQSYLRVWEWYLVRDWYKSQVCGLLLLVTAYGQYSWRCIFRDSVKTRWETSKTRMWLQDENRDYMKVEFKVMYFTSTVKVKLQETLRPQLEFWVPHVGFILTCITRSNAISQSRLKVESTSITKFRGRFTFVWRHWGAYWLCQILSSWFLYPCSECFVIWEMCAHVKKALLFHQCLWWIWPFCLFWNSQS